MEENLRFLIESNNQRVEALKEYITDPLQQQQLTQWINKINQLIAGLKTEQANLRMLMDKPKMERILGEKSMEFQEFLDNLILQYGN